MIRNLKLLLLWLLAKSALASNFSIDFSSSLTYVDSLNYIRQQIAEPIHRLSMHQTSVFMIRQHPVDTFLRISLDGIDIDQPHGQRSNIHLIVNPSNLYVMGWVNVRTDTFYRFSDFNWFSLPNVTHTLPLTNDSSYTTLQRVGNTNRLNMTINRLSLTGAYHDLNNFNANSLDQATARALIRIITVTSESIRFRSIQREFRPFLDLISPAAYVFGENEVDLTLNWARISNTIPDHQGDQPVRVGRITLPNLTAIIGTVAVILNCHHDDHARNRRSIDNQIKNPDCPNGRPLLIEGVLWDNITIDGIRQALSK